MQPVACLDDSFDDNAHKQRHTETNTRKPIRGERTEAANVDERTRTGSKVFLNRVSEVRILSGPPV
jgi:hypothetical protein